jgi:hypothetical protein
VDGAAGPHGADPVNAALLSRRYGREPVSTYISGGWKVMPFEIGGVAFHRVGRAAITVGAPLCPEGAAEGATLAFREHCRSKGWRPVIFQAGAPVDGLRSYRIAREAFLDVADFSLAGSAKANARHSVSRARRDGTEMSWRRWSECDAETRAEMALISRSWCGRRPELTFTYGRFSDIPDDAWVGVARATGGRIEAFSTWRPLPAGPGLVLDLMRRRKDSTPGVMELMIAEAIHLARSQSLAWLSLGSVTESGDLPRWLRVLVASTGACGGSGLSSFKDKFCPRWEDRYLALPARGAGIAGLVALAIAHLAGAKERPGPAESIPARRPALRWAATAGMAVSLGAFGVGAAAHDIRLPVAGPPQLSLSAAIQGIMPGRPVPARSVRAPGGTAVSTGLRPANKAPVAHPQASAASNRETVVRDSRKVGPPPAPPSAAAQPAATLASNALCTANCVPAAKATSVVPHPTPPSSKGTHGAR